MFFIRADLRNWLFSLIATEFYSATAREYVVCLTLRPDTNTLSVREYCSNSSISISRAVIFTSFSALSFCNFSTWSRWSRFLCPVSTSATSYRRFAISSDRSVFSNSTVLCFILPLRDIFLISGTVSYTFSCLSS